MALILFIIFGGLGIVFTQLWIRTAKRRKISDHRFALGAGIGFGLTWMAATFAPILYPPNQLYAKGFIMFMILHSVFVGIVAYTIIMIYLKIKKER